MHRQLGTYVLYEKNFFRHVPYKSKKWSRINKVHHALRSGGLGYGRKLIGIAPGWTYRVSNHHDH